MRTVRVLYVSGATGWGGAEVVLGHLLAAVGPHVEPLLLGVDPEVVERLVERRPGLPARVLPPVRDRSDRAAWLAQRRAVAGARADVVHLNLPVPAASRWTVLAAASVPGPRLVAVEHLPLPLPGRGARLVKRAVEPRLAAHLAVGARAAAEVERLVGLAPGRVRAVPNGVPAPHRPPDDRPAGAPPVVAAVGRLDRHKGLDVLVRAVAALPGTRLLLVGDGPEREALEDLARQVGLAGRLAVTGWTARPWERLGAVDVLALPSRAEGLPLVLLEAMHAGLPVVATPVGSVPDALEDGRTGLLVPVDDDRALAAALGRLLADPAERARLGGAAQERARARFGVAAMARAYEAVYDAVLSPAP